MSQPADRSDGLQALFSLEKKIALVTGGSRGIGRSIAETYARAGADVVVAARTLRGSEDAAREIASRYGRKAIGIAMDVTNVTMVDAGVRGVIDRFGEIDVLVNCAGISGRGKPILEMADGDMTEVMNVVFYGTFFVSRAVGRVMARRRSGKIINVSSVLGTLAARNQGGYCASKAAVVQLTRVLALELMDDNVQVNVISPGYFATDFTREFLEGPAGEKFLASKIPAKRAGHVDEIQSTALYLATCPPFLVGAEIRIDGGHSLV